MRLLICLTLITFAANGQCGREYPSGFYHNNPFVSANGDTLNSRDGDDLYHGQHLYTEQRYGNSSDTETYITGRFEHGVPVGEWLDHCSDGTYSKGAFDMGGGQHVPDSNGRYVLKKQGIYVKVGLWRYFNKGDSLIKSEFYKREEYKKGWANSTYRVDNSGKKVLVYYESLYNYGKNKQRRIRKEYSNVGLPISKEYSRKRNLIEYTYDYKGRLQRRKVIKYFRGNTAPPYFTLLNYSTIKPTFVYC